MDSKIFCIRLITPIPPVTPIDDEEEGRAMFVLEREWRIEINGIVWTFMPGLKTDFASIPRFLWWLFNPTDPHTMAASFFHDQGYRGDLKKAFCDNAFRAIMEARGVNKAQSNIMWAAVSSPFGVIAYRRNKADVIKFTREHVRVGGTLLSEMKLG